MCCLHWHFNEPLTPNLQSQLLKYLVQFQETLIGEMSSLYLQFFCDGWKFTKLIALESSFNSFKVNYINQLRASQVKHLKWFYYQHINNEDITRHGFQLQPCQEAICMSRAVYSSYPTKHTVGLSKCERSRNISR